MMTKAAARTVRDLGDGLVLHFATPSDIEQLVAFNELVMSDNLPETHQRLGVWARDLLTGRFPGVGPEQFTVVEDTRSGCIASSLCVLPQRWAYGGIPFGVGQIELVGTHPDYRNRGLIRKQFDVIHDWCMRNDLPVTAIDGIPWYYRQFGYEYALEERGGRILDVATLADAEKIAALTLRPSTDADIPFLIEVSATASHRSLVSVVRDTAQWQYDIDGHSADSLVRSVIQVIQRSDGEDVGVIIHTPEWHIRTAVFACELRADVAWSSFALPLVSAIRALARQQDRVAGRTPSTSVFLRVGSEHPLYDYLPTTPSQRVESHAWYIRVADLPGFISHIAPVLETRLAGSARRQYSGELRLSFYRDGLRLRFVDGKLTTCEAWRGPESEAAAMFPNLTFLQLLFGYRSLAELRYAFPDCETHSEEACVLLDSLFPRRSSAFSSVV